MNRNKNKVALTQGQIALLYTICSTVITYVPLVFILTFHNGSNLGRFALCESQYGLFPQIVTLGLTSILPRISSRLNSLLITKKFMFIHLPIIIIALIYKFGALVGFAIGLEAFTLICLAGIRTRWDGIYYAKQSFVKALIFSTSFIIISKVELGEMESVFAIASFTANLYILITFSKSILRSTKSIMTSENYALKIAYGLPYFFLHFLQR